MRKFNIGVKIFYTLQHTALLNVKINAFVIIDDIEKHLKLEYDDGTRGLDIRTYFISCNLIDDLKKKMTAHSQMKLKIYQEFFCNSLNLSKVKNML